MWRLIIFVVVCISGSFSLKYWQCFSFSCRNRYPSTLFSIDLASLMKILLIVEFSFLFFNFGYAWFCVRVLKMVSIFIIQQQSYEEHYFFFFKYIRINKQIKSAKAGKLFLPFFFSFNNTLFIQIFIYWFLKRHIMCCRCAI